MVVKFNLILMEERRVRVFENKMLRRIFVPRGMRKENGEDATMRNFVVCTVRLI